MTDIQNNEVEGQFFGSDEKLKEAIATVENALATLSGVASAQGDDAEVEGQYFGSDAKLKEAVSQLETALSTLRALNSAATAGQASVESARS